ncbi:MAG TPA: glucose-6-phosphate dehydrogenase [Coriobacteriia bacterium]
MAHSPQDLPTVLVVFGATGDLMERKIVPALYHLHEKGRLPRRFRVIGFARRPLGDDAFRASVVDTVLAHSSQDVSRAAAHRFAKTFSYAQGHFDEGEAYGRLMDTLVAIDGEWAVCANKLFYLAVPPENYRVILKELSGSGLTAPCDDGGWTRVLVEKPFGRDGATAQRLDDLLGTLFEERQIYRIDHYLAKEMVQGVMSFRFNNNLLEPSWNDRGIERIEIDLLETLDAAGRGAFYDGIGALRDVGQNHLLQMLALVTMEQPATLDADAIRAQRVAALRALPPMTGAQIRSQTFRAQYDGYRATEGVAPASMTETFFRVVTALDTPRWRGVPVVLQGGKALGSMRKDVVVTFRHPHPCLCAGEHAQNRVTFRLEPADSVSIAFWTKKPGFETALEERDFDFFLYEKQEKAQYVEEYARLISDAIAGDQTLFVSTREVRAMWEFIDPIVSAWAADEVPLRAYAPASDAVLGEAGAALAVPPLTPTSGREIGIVGLGKMGSGLARNLIEHGWRVVGHNRSGPAIDALVADGGVSARTLAGLVAALRPPRTVWLMVPAGPPVDDVLFGRGGLAGLLEPGDVVIDGGNSRYSDDIPRAEHLAARRIRFVDVGTSGGPGGARSGACPMIGGDRDVFERLRPLWEDVSIDGGFRFFPGVGAGHFVKMVHNGIEYGMMQALAEGFTILRATDYSIDLSEAAAVYDRGSVIESRLVGWLEAAFRLHGEDLEGVGGAVGYTGEGEWTVRAARKLGVRARVIEDALRFRMESERDPDWTGCVLSALREQFGGHAVSAASPAGPYAPARGPALRQASDGGPSASAALRAPEGLPRPAELAADPTRAPGPAG